jgi:hypothetical protein
LTCFVRVGEGLPDQNILPHLLSKARSALSVACGFQRRLIAYLGNRPGKVASGDPVRTVGA